MHPVAEQGFSSTVDAYRRGRPSYPSEAVDWLVQALRLAPGRTVVDIGAGTGKFTALLVPSGAYLVAVEPLAAMREGFAADLPELNVADGSAEAIPLADQSADAIVAAQAFHWFDRARALPEFARVLRNDGRLGVIWNDIDTAVEWASDFYAIVSPGRDVTPVPWSAAVGDLAPWFGPRHEASFAFAHVQDRDSLLARVDSMSWIAARPVDEREDIKRRVGALLDTHPSLAGRDNFDLPYVTHAWWAERVSAE